MRAVVRYVLVAALGACAAPRSESPGIEVSAPLAEGSAPSETLAAEPPRDEAALATEACQAAAELLASGDRPGAVRRVDECYAAMLAIPEGDSADQTRQDLRLLAADLVRRIYEAPESRRSAPLTWDLGLPMFDNQHVQREIRSFTTVEREQFLAAYRRSGRYRPMILQKLEAAGLPTQLSWLPLVESSFEVNALSRAAALGLWQFIASTGLRYGLTRDAWVDERLHPEKATDAAINYFLDLHQLFGDWAKALAAYNCGESQVARLQQRSPGEYVDFWDLYALLPQETRRYFPRLLAVLQIVEDPSRFGLTLPEVEPPDDAVVLRIERPVKLADLEGALGLEPGRLAALNPELRHRATPSRPYDLRVPAGRGDDLTAVVATLATYEPPRDPEFIVHRVRSGETLSIIAERYRASLAAILRFNRLRSANRIYPGQRLKIPLR